MRRESLKRIAADLKVGKQPTPTQAAQIQADWIRRFGTGGCDHFPYVTGYSVIRDLLQKGEGE